MAATAAEAAWAAQAQGKFWPLYEALVRATHELDRAAIERLAREVGVDVGALADALDGGRYRARVAEDGEKVRGAKLRVPGFIVNGRAADGLLALVALVDTTLKKAGRRLPPLPVAAERQDQWFWDASVPQRFHLEARNDAWAASIEKQLAPMIERDLRAIDPEARAGRLECKTSVCRVRWTPGRLGPGPARALLAQLYLAQPASRTAPPTPELYLREQPSPIAGTRPDLVTRVKSRRAGVLYGLAHRPHQAGRRPHRAIAEGVTRAEAAV